jgi:hypothetical protein
MDEMLFVLPDVRATSFWNQQLPKKMASPFEDA